MPESCPIFLRLIYEDYCDTQGFLLSKQLYLIMPSNTQLISSLFKINICV